MKLQYKFFAIILIFLASSTLPSCKKYADGPAFSLRSKKARITGDWSLESASINGTDITNSFSSNFAWNIEEDNSFKMKAVGSGTLLTEVTGTWKFGEDMDDVYFTSNGVETSYRITRLKNTELWFYYTAANGDKLTYKLKK